MQPTWKYLKNKQIARNSENFFINKTFCFNFKVDFDFAAKICLIANDFSLLASKNCIVSFEYAGRVHREEKWKSLRKN